MQPDPTPTPCIAVVGSTMMDLIAYVDRAPSAGETVIGRRFSQGFGGKGANQAVMAARLGAQVAMVACVGDDAFEPLSPSLLAVTEWLVPNEVELDGLVGPVNSTDDDAALVRAWRAMGPRLLVTLGAAGAALVGEDRVVRVPTPPVDAVDTTGAGDAFIGAFAVGMGLGRGVEASIDLGHPLRKRQRHPPRHAVLLPRTRALHRAVRGALSHRDHPWLPRQVRRTG